MDVPWVEKYRPTKLDQLHREKNVELIRLWAKKWRDGIPDKRGLLIVGPPGTGKTSAAIALSKEMGWDYIEFNASDIRSRESINDTALRGSLYSSISEFSGRKKLIVMDEVDSLYERNVEGADAGGKSAISNLLDKTMNPVILIANDLNNLRYGSTGKSIVDKCQKIEFQRYRTIQIVNILREICKNENIFCSREMLLQIAENSNGDMRAAINDLQGNSEHVAPQERDVAQNIYNTISNIIYKRDSFINIRNDIINSGEEPNNFILFLLENIFPFNLDKESFVLTLENIARADLFLGRVSKRMNYGLWGYATDLMASSVFYNLKAGKYMQFTFPSFIRGMSQLKKFRAVREDFAFRVGRYVHKSKLFMNRETLSLIYVLMQRDEGIKKKLQDTLDIDYEEISNLYL